MVPQGGIGEICIAGDGVTRGYRNREALTARKFVGDPFFEGQRMYSTGDLGRWLPDGNLDFLGRMDDQVKVRGFRIELEEIKRQLIKHKDVKTAVVVVHKSSSLDRRGYGNDDNYLCAYFVSKRLIEDSELRRFLSEQLPEHMVPTYFIRLERIPLTVNGKVDKKALPGPEIAAPEGYTAPRDEVEKKLSQIWSEVLGVEREKIGIDSDFFRLGGHSIKATLVMSGVYREFKTTIPLNVIFEAPTLRQLAGYIREAGADNTSIKDHHLVLLTKKNDNPGNLFLVHDASGEVDGYIEFCNHLTNEYNCWGIRADSFKDCAPQKLTIEEIAEKYIKVIKSVQPLGPYYIAGWSLGGTIAFEMVGQLEEMNDDVRFFAMIDAKAPHHDLMADISEFTVKSELDWIQSHLTAKGEIKEKPGNINDINLLWDYIVGCLEANNTTVEHIIKRIPGEQARLLLGFESLNIRELIKYINRIRTLVHAKASYAPSKEIKTPVHFFYASQSGEMIKHNWTDYFYHPLKTYEIEGSHFSIFRMPHVLTFVKIFDEVVEGIAHHN